MLWLFRHSIRNLYKDDALAALIFVTDFPGEYVRYSKNLYIEGREGSQLWIAHIGYLNPCGLKAFDTLFPCATLKPN